MHLHGRILVKPPADATREQIAQLHRTAERFGGLLRNRERIDFHTWAARIDGAAVDSEVVRSAASASLRTLCGQAGSAPEPPQSLIPNGELSC